MKIFLTGGSSGVGEATQKLLSNLGYDVYAPTSKDFDLTNFALINSLNFSEFDVIINCAARNRGTYQGLFANDWTNQLEQINVNYTAPLFIAKQYLKQRKEGQFIYISSDSIDVPSSYNIFMASSKAALRFSMDTLKRDYPTVIFTEICPGKIKTNMLKQNFGSAKTDEEIDEIYSEYNLLSPEEVAKTIYLAIEHKLDKVTILPHGPLK